MASYFPPTENLPIFNPSVFNSSLTNNEIDTKIKTLETFKLQSIANQYLEVGLIDTPSGVAGGVVVFTRPFSQKPVVRVQVINGTTSTVQTMKIYNVTTTQFSYLGRKTNGSTVTNTIADFNYVAIGNR
tara:strand:- start:101 stop:487 length:387 start_codon:yes stop_codon:yes gene_type:complete